MISMTLTIIRDKILPTSCLHGLNSAKGLSASTNHWVMPYSLSKIPSFFTLLVVNQFMWATQPLFFIINPFGFAYLGALSKCVCLENGIF
jgi:hypothetical protein